MLSVDQSFFFIKAILDYNITLSSPCKTALAQSITFHDVIPEQGQILRSPTSKGVEINQINWRDNVAKTYSVYEVSVNNDFVNSIFGRACIQTLTDTAIRKTRLFKYIENFTTKN